MLILTDMWLFKVINCISKFLISSAVRGELLPLSLLRLMHGSPPLLITMPRANGTQRLVGGWVEAPFSLLPCEENQRGLRFGVELF